jgi:hypothetical protein
MITPNTTAAPAAAPSVASEIAKQFASLAIRTGRPSRDERSSRSGRPISQTELAFLTKPVVGEIAPGIPTPTVAVPSLARLDRERAPDGKPRARTSSSITTETIAASVAS